MKTFTLASGMTAISTSDSFGGSVGDDSYDGLHTYQVNITGAPTAVTISIEGSLDGVLWTELSEKIFSAGELTATTAMFQIVDKPVTYLRANLTVLTGGTAPTVTVLGRVA